MIRTGKNILRSTLVANIVQCCSEELLFFFSEPLFFHLGTGI